MINVSSGHPIHLALLAAMKALGSGSQSRYVVVEGTLK
jgi:hypothetical protein